MVLLGPAVRNAANIVLKERHRTAAVTREATAAAVTEATTVDTAAAMEAVEKATRDKAYRVANDA
jgi:hypothetical protein